MVKEVHKYDKGNVKLQYISNNYEKHGLQYINDELIKLIGERSENEKISRYILNSLIFCNSQNEHYGKYLCDCVLKMLLNNKNLVFKIVDDRSYFSEYRNMVCIDKHSIRRHNYPVFIHEITHAIHSNLILNMIPPEYNMIRNKITTREDFMVKAYSLLRFIIEIKKKIIKCQKMNKENNFINSSMTNNYDSSTDGKSISNFCDNSDLKKFDNSNSLSNIYDGNLLKISDSINFFKNIYDNSNDYIKKADGFDSYFKNMIFLTKKLDSQFLNSLVDNVDYVEKNEEVEQLFYVLNSMEDVIDSLLLGRLYDGYRSGCFFLRGPGHGKDYFLGNPNISYCELLADFSVLYAYNDSMLLEIIKLVIGDEMYNLLNSSLRSMIVSDIDKKNDGNFIKK